MQKKDSPSLGGLLILKKNAPYVCYGAMLNAGSIFVCAMESQAVECRNRDVLSGARIAAGLLVAVLVLEGTELEDADLVPLPYDLLGEREECVQCLLHFCRREVRLFCHGLDNSAASVDFRCFFLWYYAKRPFLLSLLDIGIWEWTQGDSNPLPVPNRSMSDSIIA